MNIVVIDSGRLAGDADFPMPELRKLGWLQYAQTQADEVAERCWRSDIIITVATPVDKVTIDKAFKLKLIAIAGEDHGHVDTDAARERGITVCNVPGLDPQDARSAVRICHEVIANINEFVRGGSRNPVT